MFYVCKLRSYAPWVLCLGFISLGGIFYHLVRPFEVTIFLALNFLSCYSMLSFELLVTMYVVCLVISSIADRAPHFSPFRALF
ncbi:hypothetical protein L1887_02026 [Cichorium endivia]|nr:hypothetical protein L1887_02026 [Cichorium endivia]